MGLGICGPILRSRHSWSASASRSLVVSMVGPAPCICGPRRQSSSFVTGLMARELGGGRLAQATASARRFALSTTVLIRRKRNFNTRHSIICGGVLIAYFVIRLLKSENPRWWVAIGVVMGIGFETKYTMGVFTLAELWAGGSADGCAVAIS